MKVAVYNVLFGKNVCFGVQIIHVATLVALEMLPKYQIVNVNTSLRFFSGRTENHLFMNRLCKAVSRLIDMQIKLLIETQVFVDGE